MSVSNRIVIRLGTIGLVLALWCTEAFAFEALDGRVQAHGYYEMQLRLLNKNFSDQWDVSQWYNVFNVELEFEFVRDTHGPLDLLSAFVRLEGRYDCIYSRGCGMIRSVDAYGNRSKRLPSRLNRGDDFTGAGQALISNDGPFSNAQHDPLHVGEVPGFAGILENTPEGLGPLDRIVFMQCSVGVADCDETHVSWRPGGAPVRLWSADRNRRVGTTDTELINASNPDCLFNLGPCAIDDGTDGAPFLLALSDFRDYRFTSIPIIGGGNYGHPTSLMGPWLPKNKIEPNATGGRQPNPMDASRIMPQSLTPGSGAHPMRPIPILREDDSERFTVFVRQDTAIEDPKTLLAQPITFWETINPLSDDRRWHNDRSARSWEARGLFVPSPNLKRAMQEDKFGDFDFNFSETERAFNHGSSQQDEGELKEAYFDVEMFDSRLWMRIGKQAIVWGKTELFRTTDQFNPQDFGLASLPSLEESRIGLWAWRGVYSFYEVGPLEDVRIEAAFNFDQFESADLGACGEPYTINLVCSLTFGSWVHGMTGLGVAGIVTPPAPWDSSKGLEGGARTEFRWDRFSFAISDYYGYDDFPHVERLTTYSRNVDWRSGRPRYYMDTPEQMKLSALGQGLPCSTPTGSGVVDTDGDGVPDSPGTSIGFDGPGNEGCLYPGPSDRTVDQFGGGKQLDIRSKGLWTAYAGNFVNDTTRSDSEESQLRQFYSTPTKPDPNDPDSWAWPVGPNAHLCDQAGVLANADGCKNMAGKRGARVHDANPLIHDDANGCRYLLDTRHNCPVTGTLNPDYDPMLEDGKQPNPQFNPYYDPRLDPAFDPAVTLLRYHSQPDNQPQQTATKLLAFVPRPRALEPVPFDPFRVHDIKVANPTARWGNAYDSTLLYDSRNALDVGPVNLSLFNFVCAATVGFSELDAAACAQTVFSSSKPASPKFDTRVSFVISGLLVGDQLFNGFLSGESTDDLTFKGKLLPNMPIEAIPGSVGAGGMGIPTLKLHNDRDADAENEAILLTHDIRSEWAYSRYAGAMGSTPPDIASRDLESYNCRGKNFGLSTHGGAILCGGLAIGTKKEIDGETYLAQALTPEQEALLGCGPFYGTHCDSNGLDLLNAEGSALLQSFIAADSRGIACAKLGLCDLIPDAFGAMLTDPGSDPLEYRTDGRVIGRDGNLLRMNPDTGAPELGSETGLLAIGKRQSYWQEQDGSGTAECDYSNITGDAFFPGDDLANRGAAIHHRWNRRCWDLRPYYQIYGLQPGTATFEILGLGGPKCTTADIGGPVGAAGILPGCRNKWATIRYQNAADPNVVLDPNNPAAGYAGNNYLGSALDPTEPDPRTDYRQLDLTTLGCDSTDPDCSPHSPLDTSAPLAERSGLNWGVYAPQQTGCSPDVNDPTCYLGGWRQTIDGDPDKLGVLDNNGFLLFPRRVADAKDVRGTPVYALRNPDGSPVLKTIPDPSDPTKTVQVPKEPDILSPYVKMIEQDQGARGTRVENGCTPGSVWIFLQRTADNHFMGPSECAHLYTGIGAGHPFTGESFSSEMAGLSLNFMNLLVTFSDEFLDGLASVRGYVYPERFATDMYDADVFPQGEKRPQRDPSLRNILDDFPDLAEYERRTNDKSMRIGEFHPGIGRLGGLFNTMQWDYAFTGSENDLIANIPYCKDLVVTQTKFGTGQSTNVNDAGPRRIDCSEGLAGRTLGRQRCTFVTPQYCGLVQAVYSIAGQKRNVLRAGGDGTFGRRTMQWQSGGEIFLSYEKRNVLGFSTDFAEDYSKSNWSMEFTWIEGVPQSDADSYEGFTRTDDFNLTISVDRPTFINFLNPNRTFFLNSQWFFQYRKGYTSGMSANGPLNVLATVAILTGYFQDRLNPQVIFVYDFQSVSAAVLPEVSYRFSENFSITVGASIFMGKQQLVDMPVNGVAPASPRTGPAAYKDSAENGLSLIRDRDEAFMRLRYTF